MQGITPTVVSVLDMLERQYGMSNQVPVDQLLNTYLDLNTPLYPGSRVCKAIMLGNDGREHRSAKCSHVYSPLPLISRPLSSPLTSVERQNYYLRKVVSVKDVLYEIYYGKTLPPLDAVAAYRYGTYDQPTSVPNLSPILLPSPTYDWSATVASPAVVRIAGDMVIEFSVIDVASMEAACALLEISDVNIREVGMVAGVPYTVSPGVEELSSAICTYHYSLTSPLVPPGITMACGMIGGLAL